MYVSCTFECGHSVSFSICYSVLCSNPSDVDVILFPVINEPYVPSQISRIIKSFFIGKNKWLVLISASITLFSFRSYGRPFLSLRFALFSVLYPLRAPSICSWHRLSTVGHFHLGSATLNSYVFLHFNFFRWTFRFLSAYELDVCVFFPRIFWFDMVNINGWMFR